MSARPPLSARSLALIARDLLRGRDEARKMRSSLVIEALEARRRCAPDKSWGSEAPIDTGSEVPALLAAAAFQRIADIDDALVRIATSDFGQCADCGEGIPYQRLRALPTTTTYVCSEHAGPTAGTEPGSLPEMSLS